MKWPLAVRSSGAGLRPLRFDLQELSGGLGDLGVMVPIIATLIAANGFNATSVLLVFGLTYIITGLYYRIPVPVQPLKAMAAIAIAQGLAPEVVSTAGIIMGVILLGLAASGLIEPLTRVFSKPVVRGIQVAVGVLLIQAGLKLSLGDQVVRGGPEALIAVGGSTVPVAAIIALALAPVLVLAIARPRLPVIAMMLPPALAFGFIATPGAPFAGLGIGPSLPDVNIPTGNDFLTAFLVLVIPQVPLTLGNSVIACSDTARDYFGADASRVHHRSLLTSKGLANVFGGLIGGMPVCHGAGGLTAHYRFGARTGGATVMLGGFLLVLAIGFGSGAAQVLGLIPLPVLGALLCVVGAQHALLARDVRPGMQALVVVTIAGVAYYANNVAIGFACGIALDQLTRLPGSYRWVRARLLPAPPEQAEAQG